ncbi:MAG: glycosyltransferase [Patescibacteria group bacterium]|nr:glycosyltransferase [Patescibacteria group bacterium]
MQRSEHPTATIVLLTKNGARYLKEVLAQIFAQRSDFPFECIAIDSGSTDATLAILARYPVRVERISTEKFNHGETRNFGARLARGEFIVFLTQDATPENAQWLYRLVSPMQQNQEITAVCSRQIPRETCNPVVAGHLESSYPLCANAEEIKHFSAGTVDRQTLRRCITLSNVSAAYRTATLRRNPFPKTDFAEDAAWECSALRRGETTLFQPQSVVIHSHAYSLGGWLRRCYLHAWAMQQIYFLTDSAHPVSASHRKRSIHSTIKNDWINLGKRNFRGVRRLGWVLYGVAWHGTAMLGTALGARGENNLGLVHRLLSRRQHLWKTEPEKNAAATISQGVSLTMPPQPITRVLHIVEATQTGVGRHVLDLITHADRKRFQPALCYSLERSDAHFRAALTALRAQGVPLYAVPMFKTFRPFKNFRAVRAIREILQHGQFTVIHTHSSIAGMVGRFAARRSRTPVVIYTPNGWPFLSTGDRALAGAYRQLERRAAKWCDRIICVSRHEQELGVRLHIAPAEKFAVIHNGIDAAAITGDRRQARQTLGLPDDAIALGTITRFAYQKDPLGMLEALAPLLREQQNLMLIAIGEGPLKAAAESTARHLGIQRQVMLTGFRQDATALLSGFDMFLLPSRYEGLSYAMLEAMAAGLPIITTAGGNSEAVSDDDNGFIVPVGDHSALRTAVSRLVQDPALRSRLGRRSRQKIENFTVQRQVQLTESLYDQRLKEYQNKG